MSKPSKEQHLMQDEKRIIKMLQSSNPDNALTYLFDTYADRIYRLALSLLSDPFLAEDIVQQTFLKAITHRHQFEGRSSISSWLYRIAYNASHDTLRKKNNLPFPDEEPYQNDNIPLPKVIIEWRLSPEEYLQDNETRQQIEKAIQKLPEKLRTVFLLRDTEGLSIEETMNILQISKSAVKVRLHRARLALREMLSAYFAERYKGGSSQS